MTGGQNKRPLLRYHGEWCTYLTPGLVEINGRGGPGRGVQCRFGRLGPASSLMSVRWLLPVLWALSAEADFFQLDSISNVSTYYFNYFYCNIWEGDCQPNQDDATQQGKRPNEMMDVFLNYLF